MSPTTEPFGAALRSLLISRGITTKNGNPDWVTFAERLPNIHYETLRKAVTGDRYPARKVIEAVSLALEVEPTVFAEYDLWDTQRQFDPREVGLSRALWNAQRWKKVVGG